MSNPAAGPYRLAVLTALGAVILEVSGAVLTVPAGAADQGRSFLPGGIFNEQTHIGIAIVVAALTAALALWLSRSAFARLGWATFGVLLLDGALGLGKTPLPASLSIPHAFLAPLFLSAVTAIMVFTSPGWTRGPDLTPERGLPSLSSLAAATPLAVLLQIMLGAAYRHQVLSVMPHMAGAMAVALLTLVVSVVVLQNYPGHRALGRAASSLITIALVQICLGIASFLMPLLDAQNSPVFVWITAAHVVVGALTMAASVVLAIQIRRNVQRPAPAPGPATTST